MNVGYVECCIGNLLEGDPWDVRQGIGQASGTIFSNKTLVLNEKAVGQKEKS